MKNHALVESLVNAARPQLVAGCDVRATGCGEATVRHAGLRRYAVVAEGGELVVPLLDGEHTLNDVAAEVMRKKGRVRHQVILDTLVRLHAAGLLEPIEPALDRYLARQARSAQAGRGVRMLRRLANLETHLPIPWRSRPGDDTKPPRDRQRLALVTLALGLLSLCWTGVLLWPRLATDTVFGRDVLGGMLLAATGVCAAASIRAIARAVLLRHLGRDVLGLGLRLTAGIPHLSVDARDERMLDRSERIRYRAKTLLVLSLVGAALQGASLAPSLAWLWPLALGWQALLLAQLSPLWPGDGTRLLEELLGHRHLGRVSRVYVVRKLWHHLARLRGFSGEDLGLVVFASVRLAYVFIAVAVLAAVLPGTVDGVTAALLEPGRSGWERLVAATICLYLGGALLLVLLGLLSVLWGGLRQLFSVRRAATRPAAVVDASTLAMAELSQELQAIPPFSDMPEDLLLEALKAGRVEQYHEGSIIIRQGDAGETCYVIRGGRCGVRMEDTAGRLVATAQLGPGHLFGEVALLENVPRTATIVAVDDVELIAFDGATFLEMVDRSGVPREAITETLRIHLFLQRVELLRGLGARGMRTLLKASTVHRPEVGEVVVRQGEEGYSMFLVYQGQFDVVVDDTEVAVLGPGQYFGEIALVTGAVRTASVVCKEAGILVEVPATTYQEVIVREFASGVLLDKEVDSRLEELELL